MTNLHAGPEADHPPEAVGLGGERDAPLGEEPVLLLLGARAVAVGVVALGRGRHRHGGGRGAPGNVGGRAGAIADQRAAGARLLLGASLTGGALEVNEHWF